jgi:hypothetical protein
LFSAGGNPGTGWRLSLSRTAVGLVAAAIVVALIAAVVITVVIDHTGR